jgi:outer membrane receptor for ferrienterochelin and colicin
MSIIVADKGAALTPAPEGVWQAVCCDVVELDGVETQWGVKDMVQIRWQLSETNEDHVDDDYGPQPHMVLRRYTRSLNQRSNLRKDLESWRGKKFTAKELEGFDLEKLIGANCQIQVMHSVADMGNVWANVQAVLPHRKGEPKLEVSDGYVRKKDRPDRNGNGPDVETDDNGEPVPF